MISRKFLIKAMRARLAETGRIVDECSDVASELCWASASGQTLFVRFKRYRHRKVYRVYFVRDESPSYWMVHGDEIVAFIDHIVEGAEQAKPLSALVAQSYVPANIKAPLFSGLRKAAPGEHCQLHLTEKAAVEVRFRVIIEAPPTLLSTCGLSRKTIKLLAEAGDLPPWTGPANEAVLRSIGSSLKALASAGDLPPWNGLSIDITPLDCRLASPRT